MDDTILEAIKAGELEHQKQLDEQKTKEAKAEKAHLEWIEECKIRALAWAINVLPTLIKEATSKGTKTLHIGSSDYNNADYTVLCKIKEAKLRGLKIIEHSYDANPGEEGCYSHGAGCSYSIDWNI